MPNVEMMEHGSPLKQKGNTSPARPGHKSQTQEPAPKFLNELKAKLPEPSNPGPVKDQEESREGKSLENELPPSKAEESVTPKGPAELSEKAAFQLKLYSETADLTSPSQGMVEGEQKNEAIPPGPFSFFEFSGEEKRIVQGEGFESSPVDQSDSDSALGWVKEQGAVLKLQKAPVFEGPGRTEELIEENSLPDQGRNGEKLVTKGVLDKKTGGTHFEADAVIAPDRPSPRANMPFLILEGAQGESPEALEEQKSRVSLFQGEIFFNPSKEEEGISFQSASKTSSGFEGLKGKIFPEKGEIDPQNETDRNPIPPLDFTDRGSWNSVRAEKNYSEHRPGLDYSKNPFETDFHNDPAFTVKSQGPTSLEISLEPAGLGKLDLELNLNQDRLQGQFLVQDNAGKELIERNLPQLLSDLAREGFQIGGFTVSLKNQGQGKGQNQLPVRIAPEVTALVPAGPEPVGPIYGSNLIHIII